MRRRVCFLFLCSACPLPAGGQRRAWASWIMPGRSQLLTFRGKRGSAATTPYGATLCKRESRRSKTRFSPPWSIIIGRKSFLRPVLRSFLFSSCVRRDEFVCETVPTKRRICMYEDKQQSKRLCNPRKAPPRIQEKSNFERAMMHDRLCMYA